MKVLFIGDIVGKSGRDIVSSSLFDLKKEHNIDLVIANGENSAHGKGITYKIYKELLNEGVDYITMGNHSFSKSEINDHIDDMNNLIIPYNHSLRTNGNYYKIINFKGIKFCLTNILGTALIPVANLDQYESFKQVINDTCDQDIDFYFVDLHAETTAEKRLFAEYFKDYAKVVVGTHTHVQTADERMIDDCAFITDVGMCGAYDSIIGRDINESIDYNINKMETHYTIAEGDPMFCAVVIDIDNNTKKPVSIKRIQLRPY